MKAVILCGGKGTRMREETEYRPKPLVEIGGKPIIWHIMKLYSHYGINDFILCTGYKGHMIKQYFMEMHWRNNDFTLNTCCDGKIIYHYKQEENWTITIVDTGQETMTGGRLKQVEKYIEEDKFMFTYGDGLSDVDIAKLLEHHEKSGKIATVTGVHPTSPFGLMEVKDGNVVSFREKPVLKDMINGGYMILGRKVFDYLEGPDCYFEQGPLMGLVRDRQLAVYEHNGFWAAIDTFKDVEKMNEIWSRSNIPWKVWE